MQYDNIRKYRKLRRMTLKDLSDKTGISFSAISMYERGDAEPSLDKIRKIALELGVSVEDILGPDTQEMPKAKPGNDSDINVTVAFEIIRKQQETIDKQQDLESRQQDTIAKLIDMLEKKS